MDRGRVRRRLERERAAERKFDKKTAQQDIEATAAEMRRLVSDKEYPRWSAMLKSFREIRKEQAARVGMSPKTESEIARLAVTYGAQVALLDMILDTPKKFIETSDAAKKDLEETKS